MSTPLVSVVVPVWDGAAYLREAVESALGQTWPHLEVIVVDDGSADGGVTRLELEVTDERLRVIRQANAGVSRARNAAIAAAHGELIAFLDADDVWFPDKLERQLAVFDADPEVALVHGSYVVVDAQLRGRTVIALPSDERAVRRWALLEGPGLGISFTGVVRASVLAEVGGFDESLSTSADVDLAVRLVARWRAAAAPGGPVALYRQHAGQMHRHLDLLVRDGAHMLSLDGLSDADRRRVGANLHTRVFYSSLARGDLGRAGRSAIAVVRRRPTRLVTLPLRACLNRVRLRRRVLRSDWR